MEDTEDGQRCTILFFAMEYIRRITLDNIKLPGGKNDDDDDDWLTVFVDYVLRKEEKLQWEVLGNLFIIFRNHGSQICVSSFEKDCKIFGTGWSHVCVSTYNHHHHHHPEKGSEEERIVRTVSKEGFDERVLKKLSPFMRVFIRICLKKNNKGSLTEIIETIKKQNLYAGFYLKKVDGNNNINNTGKTKPQEEYTDDISFHSISNNIYQRMSLALEQMELLQFILRSIQLYTFCLTYKPIKIEACQCKGILCGQPTCELYSTKAELVNCLQTVVQVVFLGSMSKVWVKLYSTCLHDLFTIHKLPKDKGEYLLEFDNKLTVFKKEILKVCHNEKEQDSIRKIIDKCISHNEKHNNKKKTVLKLDEYINSFFTRTLSKETENMLSIQNSKEINVKVITQMLDKLVDNLNPRIYIM